MPSQQRTVAGYWRAVLAIFSLQISPPEASEVSKGVLVNDLFRQSRKTHKCGTGRDADDRERRCTSFCFQNGVFPFLKGKSR
ncbi:hypothetical protein GGR93_002776 [Sulfitobacter noctilucicola]|uniref:Uncharacterized protein n=1 Tax=Sulfitobacter noctilucicola TaxID=1342301 RepID=A0A7W6M9L5_9RHOB|nr:hypothetical protein [Sulfitobacter noctilucicola]